MGYVKLKVVYTELIALNVMIFTLVRLCTLFISVTRNIWVIYMRHLQRQGPWSEHVKIYHNGTLLKTNIEILIRERKLTKRKY